MNKIVITISKLGVPTVDAQGFQDGSCKAATAPFIQAFTKPGEAPVEVEKPEAQIPASGGTVNVGGGW